ncbi:MAG: hypothetical protein ACLFR1_11765 [Spirochaetia bacterium]
MKRKKRKTRESAGGLGFVAAMGGVVKKMTTQAFTVISTPKKEALVNRRCCLKAGAG